MKTKKVIAELSGKKCKELVCPQCGGEVFRVDVTDSERGFIGAYCDCGYGISFNYSLSPNIKSPLTIAETVPQ